MDLQLASMAPAYLCDEEFYKDSTNNSYLELFCLCEYFRSCERNLLSYLTSLRWNGNINYLINSNFSYHNEKRIIRIEKRYVRLKPLLFSQMIDNDFWCLHFWLIDKEVYFHFDHLWVIDAGSIGILLLHIFKMKLPLFDTSHRPFTYVNQI